MWVGNGFWLEIVKVSFFEFFVELLVVYLLFGMWDIGVNVNQCVDLKVVDIIVEGFRIEFCIWGDMCVVCVWVNWLVIGLVWYVDDFDV